MPVHQAQGHLDPYLAVLSTLVAFAASYTALDLATRMRSATRGTARVWLAAAATAMGGGIWSMHFVAMLAFRTPFAVTYDPTLTALSLVLAVALTAVGLAMASSGASTGLALTIPATVMGSGIAAMHYTGTMAMRVEGHILSLDPTLVAASILVAIGASYGALRFATGAQPLRWRLMGAVLMALAVAGMHHVGMAATSFGGNDAAPVAEIGTSLAQTSLAMAVAATTFLILMLGLAASLYDRRTAETSSREALLARQIGERFRGLYRRTPLPLHSVDSEGNVEDVSDAWLVLMGYAAREEVVGRPLSDFMTPMDARIRSDRDWPELVLKGAISDKEMQFVRRDGKVVEVLLSAQVELDEDGTFIRSMEGIVDITGRKMAEAGLRQAQKMEAVGQLTGGIAHDFNNLLMIVSSALTMIERGKPPERYLAGMRQAVERASNLTRQLLAFSRKESVNAQVTDISGRLLELREMLEQSLNPGISLEILPCGDCWNAEIDPGEFDLAILNLVVNARDAMPNGGKLTISTFNADPGGQTQSSTEYVTVEVRDAGVGMDRSVMARVFEPFFTTKPAGKGTGLGLSHVYGFARQSGGSVTIESEPGKGTAIRIHLPRTNKAPERGPLDERRPSPHRERGLVLLVEDTPGVAVATAAMLKEIGYSVVHASDAEEALIRLGENDEIEFVLSDIVMPGTMNGIALAREVEKSYPGTPVLLMTGYSRAIEDEEHFHILRKPFQIEGLEARIDSVVAERVNSAA